MNSAETGPMKRRFFLIGAGASALAACATPPSRSTASLPFATDLDAHIATAIERIGVVPGLAIAVYSRDGVYAKGFGFADLETRTPVDANTAFYIASSTKPLTALALASLHTRGAFDVDATLESYAPDAHFPDVARPNEVRFRHLLSHQSGVANHGAGYRLAYSGEHDPATLWRLLSLSRANTEHPLGQFEYTNEGYNITTIMTDRKLGIQWQDLLQREVFDPAGMTRASAYMSRAKAQGVVAKPYLASMPEGPAPVYLEKTDQTMQSAGGVVMSAEDGARWIELMVEDGRIGGRQVIPAAAVQMVREQQVALAAESDGYQRTGYALGWYLGPYRDEAMMHHFGGFAGARAHVSFIPARHIGVAAFVNDSTSSATIVDAIANYVYDRSANRADADAQFEEKIASITERVERGRARVAADRAARANRPWLLSRPHADYAGRYLSDALGTIDIAVSGQQVEVRAGLMHALATAFTDPDSIRVELAPGQGWVINFEMGGSGPTGLNIMGERFVRA